MKIFKNKILFIAIFVMCIMFFGNDIKAAVSLKTISPIGKNDEIKEYGIEAYRTTPSGWYGQSDRNLRMYQMIDNKDNIVFCLEPGKLASINNTYNVITADKNSLSSIIGNNVNITASVQTSTEHGTPVYTNISVTKYDFAYKIISEVYQYEVNNTDVSVITAKQLVIWKFMSWLSVKNSNESLGTELYTILDFGLKSGNDTWDTILKKDAENILGNNSADTHIDNISTILIEKIWEEEMSVIIGDSNKISDSGFTLYTPSTVSTSTVDKHQILIGPPISDTPTPPTHYYTVLYKYYKDGDYKGTVAGTNSTYSGNKDIYPETGKNNYNSEEYQLVGASVNPGDNFIRENSSTYVTINSSVNQTATVVFYYNKVVQYDLTVNYHYINSSGAEVNTKSIPLSVNGSVSIYLKEGEFSNLRDFYTGFEKTGSISVTEPTENGDYISANVTGNATIDLYYKSKKLVVNYISLSENGNKNESGSHWNTGEIAINPGYEFKLGENIDKSWGGDYIGVKLFKNSEQIKTWNWFTTTFGKESYTNECAVYTYNVYYEVRNIHKNYVLEGKTLTTISTRKDNIISNPESKEYGSNYFAKNLTITNSRSTLYAKVNDSYYEKIVFNKTFNIGNSKSYDSDNQNSNRKTRANNFSINGEKKTYSSQDSSNRAISALAKESGYFAHADTSVINFYYNVEQPVTVLVRHIVENEDGTYTVSTSSNISFLRNTDEKYYDSVLGQNRIVSNGYNQRKYHGNASSYKDTVPSGFSEKFTIDKDDKLYLDKSRTLLYNGIQYVYQGYKTHRAYNSNNTSNKLDISSSGITTQNIDNSIEISSNGNSNRTIYVDFYYEEVDYSTTTNPTPEPDPDTDPDNPDPTPNPDSEPQYNALTTKASPELKFRSENTNGQYLGADTESIAYVPASEKVKPYFETASYVPYVLSYKLALEDGEFVYKLGDFNVYQLLDSGHEVVNKSFSEGSNAVMIGNTNENVISDGSVTASNIIQASDNDQVLKYESLGIYAKEIPVGDNTGINNFSGTKVVSGTKYNGLRLGDGTVQYRIEKISGGNYNNYKAINNVNVIDSMDVNVYTPMSIADSTIQTSSEGLVNHSDQVNTNVIQKGVAFTLTPNIKLTQKCGYGTNLPEISKYLKGYYVIFEFDVTMNGAKKEAGTPIWVDKGGSITVTPIQNQGESSVNQLQEKITTIAVTINANDDLCNALFGSKSAYTSLLEKDEYNYIVGKNETSKVTDESYNKYEVYGINMYADSYYFVKNETATIVLARLYDFKITDCYDVDFKNVFRKSGNNSSSNVVNDLTGICYYSGKNKLLITETLDIIYTRSENTILPLGPYKHTQYDYVKAPKLGYRISFDVKTYGYYKYDETDTNVNRKVVITPSYYYISKDGKTFKDNIKLYYKNSSGKYVTFEQSNYTISFKPNDGYRNTSNAYDTPDTTHLSTKLVNLTIGNSFTLEPSTMMTTSNENFIQAWYGEYKVPNSTIVVEEVEEGENLNNPLTDGYLGVKFEIKCIDTGKVGVDDKTVTIMYDTNDKNKPGVKNTSQWDYEGYMGVTAGTDFSGSLQLEKGTWTIDQSRYEQIKGTVVLYDLDERAANDFD